MKFLACVVVYDGNHFGFGPDGHVHAQLHQQVRDCDALELVEFIAHDQIFARGDNDEEFPAWVDIPDAVRVQIHRVDIWF